MFLTYTNKRANLNFFVGNMNQYFDHLKINSLHLLLGNVDLLRQLRYWNSGILKSPVATV